MVISFKLNGEATLVDALPNARLSNVLRDEFGLKSVKISSFDGLRGSDIDCLSLILTKKTLILKQKLNNITQFRYVVALT